jgi:thioredoxin 1
MRLTCRGRSCFRLAAAAIGLSVFATLSMAEEMAFDQTHYESMRDKGQPFAVVFRADRCAACRAQAPMLEQLTQMQEFKGITLFVANFDTEKVLKKSLGITANSTIVVFRNGKETARSIGDTQEDSLSEILRRAIP